MEMLRYFEKTETHTQNPKPNKQENKTKAKPHQMKACLLNKTATLTTKRCMYAWYTGLLTYTNYTYLKYIINNFIYTFGYKTITTIKCIQLMDYRNTIV